MASQQAGMSTSVVSPDRFGVVFGADMPQVEPDELEAAFRAAISDGTFDHGRWDERAISEMYPLWMLKYLPNMPACHIAIAQDARGPNNTIVLSDVSSLLAMAEGMRAIQRGLTDVMIVGGTGSRIHPLNWCFRDQVLHSPRHENPHAVSRPFDAQRDGMVYGEGAAAFIIESQRHAEARGAKILARILGFASAFETCTPGEPFEGHAIRTVIEQSLRAAGLEARDVGHVNAHGLSTLHHDRAEARAIRDTLGDVPVTALKSFFGNLAGGAGAVELIGSLIAFETGKVPFTLNYEQSDPDCPVNVVHGAPQPEARKTAVVLNHTSMGQAVALVLSA
jgi:3-oxoacyl-[acyl-carrier-protein] synthase II